MVRGDRDPHRRNPTVARSAHTSRARPYFARAARPTHAGDRRRRPGHQPPAPRATPSTWTEPLALMAERARARGRRRRGGARRRAPRSLERHRRADRDPVVRLDRPRPRARRRRATRDRAAPRRASRSPAAPSPRAPLFDAAPRIAAGELDVAAIVGAEAMKSRDLARAGRRARRRGTPRATTSPTADGRLRGRPRRRVDDHERAAGLALPGARLRAVRARAAARARAVARGARRTRSARSRRG